MMLVVHRRIQTLVFTTRLTGDKIIKTCRDFRNWTEKNYLRFRYGFIHTEELSKQFDDIEKKEKEVEYQRAQKWLKMLKNFEKFSSLNREKLHRRIFKGIPDKLRGAIWQKLLRVEESMAVNPNVYNKMLNLAHKHSTDIRQIDNDINRWAIV